MEGNVQQQHTVTDKLCTSHKTHVGQNVQRSQFIYIYTYFFNCTFIILYIIYWLWSECTLCSYWIYITDILRFRNIDWKAEFIKISSHSLWQISNMLTCEHFSALRIQSHHNIFVYFKIMIFLMTSCAGFLKNNLEWQGTCCVFHLIILISLYP